MFRTYTPGDLLITKKKHFLGSIIDYMSQNSTIYL